MRGSLILAASCSFVVAVSTGSGAYPRPFQTERVTVTTRGDEGTPGALGLCAQPQNLGPPSISASGRFVVFATPLALEPQDVNQVADVYLRDRKKNEIRMVSVNSNGNPALPDPGLVADPFRACARVGALSAFPSISADGRYVAFETGAVNFDDRDKNGRKDIYVHDRNLGTTTLASLGPGDHVATYSEFDVGSVKPSISGTGRYVVFSSDADNFLKEDAGTQAYLRDLTRGKTTFVSIAEDGTPRGVSERASVSDDGRFVTFGVGHVYVRDVRSKRTELVSVGTDGATSPVGGSALGKNDRTISANGRYVVFRSSANNLVPNDRNCCPKLSIFNATNNYSDIFVRDRRTDRTERVSLTSLGEEVVADSGMLDGSVSLSRDGRHVVFESLAPNLTPDVDAGDSFCGQFDADLPRCDWDIFVHDRLSGATDRVSLTEQRKEGACPETIELFIVDCLSEFPTMSDGRWIGFWSNNEGFAKQDENDISDVFITDRGDVVGSAVVRRVAAPSGTVERGLAAGTTVDLEGLPGVAESGDIIGATVAVRRQTDDIYFEIDVAAMMTVPGQKVAAASGVVPYMYATSFSVDGVDYEARAAMAEEPTFGLFRCRGDECVEQARLTGGWGTAGEKVVFAVPLRNLRAVKHSIDHITVDSGLGLYQSGIAQPMDSVSVGRVRT